MARNSNASSHGMFALASPLLKPLKLSGKLGLRSEEHTSELQSQR